MRRATLITAAASCFAFACRDQEAPPASPGPKIESTRLPDNKLGLPPDTKVPDGFAKLSPEMQREFLRSVWRRPIEKAQSRNDRAELVRPAPADFLPDGKDKSLKLALVPFKTRLKAGESLWYRLEMQNVGSSSITWAEMNSFFKSGVFLGSESFRLRMTLPNGTHVGGAAVPFRIGHCPGNPGPKTLVSATGVSEEDFKDVFTKVTAKSSAERELSVTLAPGEAIVTRPWHYSDPCFPKEPDSAAQAALSQGFREWPWDESRRTPGIYRLRFELYRPAPRRPSEDAMAEIERKHGMTRASQLRALEVESRFALGIVPSNEIQVELR